MTDSPGLPLPRLLESASEPILDQLLLPGAIDLLQTMRPQLLLPPTRARTLSHLVNLHIIIDDPSQRSLLFDSIPEPKIAELQHRLGAALSDLRDTPRLTPLQRRTLLGFFGQPTAPHSAITTDPSEFLLEVRHGLFHYQKRTASAVESVLYNDVPPRVMLHLPTGSGKTRIAMSIVASHLRVRNPALVIWLAETRELLEQAADEFQATWRLVGDCPMPCHRFWAHHNPIVSTIDTGIIFASLAKLRSYARVRDRLWSLGDRATLVVFDEAHHAPAETYKDLVTSLVTRGLRTGLLGLSATPGRTWNDPEEDAKLSALFGTNKVTITFGPNVNPVRRLIEDGYLASATFSRLEVSTPLSPEDQSEISRSHEIPDRIGAIIYTNTARNVAVIERLLKLSRTHHRVLVFTGSVRNALLLSSTCRALGQRADVVTADTNIMERSQAIDRFRRPGGATRLLINVGVLTTGFDAPGATAALIDRPTKSLVLYSQMVGRVLRGPKAGGSERCEVVTVVDTSLPGFGDVADAFLNWEDVWDS